MGKLVLRPTYPKEFSIGFVILVFFISFFLSHQIFDISFRESFTVYFGMFLVALAVVVMLLIIWEEILFPLKIKEVEGGVLFRNHRTKLKTQLLIYCFIPAIFIFIYLEYEVNLFRFIIWAAICLVLPVVEKIATGINNYNDFLRLTDHEIEYKNNEKEGCYKLKDVKQMVVIRDESKIAEKIQLEFFKGDSVTIDLDEMELDAFYYAIDQFIHTHYTVLLGK